MILVMEIDYHHILCIQNEARQRETQDDRAKQHRTNVHSETQRNTLFKRRNSLLCWESFSPGIAGIQTVYRRGENCHFSLISLRTLPFAIPTRIHIKQARLTTISEGKQKPLQKRPQAFGVLCEGSSSAALSSVQTLA